MGKFRVEKDGQTFDVEVADGQDPMAAVNSAISSMQPAADPNIPTLAAAAAPISGSIDEENERRQQLRIDEGRERTTGENIKRGLGLAGRVIPSAALKLPAGLADLGAGLLNIPIAGVDKLQQALGGDELSARLPTDATASADDFLNLLFPEPESFGERVVSGVGDVALTGAAGGAALAPKAVQAAKVLPGVIPAPRAIAAADVASGIPASKVGVGVPAVKDGRKVKGILEEIGLSASTKPGTFAALETSGATGAVTAGDLAAQADASPGAQIASTIAGGLTGVLAPQTAINLTRRAATTVADAASNISTGERSAAKSIQKAAADPEAAAKAAREAPEGVSPARATEDPSLLALEARVLKDDPALAAKVERDLATAEKKSLNNLAESFGPTSNKQDFQHTVIERGAAPGTTIKRGQPDEMLDSAARTFEGAYDDAKGFPIQTQSVAVEGGNVPLRTMVAEAIDDADVFTTPAIRKRVLERVEPRIDALEATGTPVLGSTAIQVDSADILRLRTSIRDKQRQLAKSGATNPDASEEAQLLGNVNKALTEMLESQLPADAATALRVVDARYGDFITVQNAVLRSGEKGLTPEALRASVKAGSQSQGRFARGEVGDLGKLAEQGKDIASTLGKGRTPGKPDQAARIVRDMTPEQRLVAKADMNEGLQANASSPTTGKLNGDKLLQQVDKNKETLRAAGFTNADIARIETIGKTLKMIQARTPAAVDELLSDNVGVVLGLLARVAGSKSGSRVLKFFGGAGVGGSLIITKFGSEQMQKTLKGLTINKADQLIRSALRGDKVTVMVKGKPKEVPVFDAIMTKPTDSLKTQAEAARTIKAFLAKAPEENESE